MTIWDQKLGYNFGYNSWPKNYIDCRANLIHSLSMEQASQKAKRLGTIHRIQELIAEVEKFATGERADLLSQDDRASLHQAWKNAKQWELEELPKQAKYREAEAKREAAARAIRDEQDRLDQLTEREKIEAWRNGENIGYSRLPMMLRIKGDKVETSYGASVSISEAVRGMRIIDAIRKKLSPIEMAWAEISGDEAKLDGLYEIKGAYHHEIIIGCHHIPWEEYDRFRPALLEYADK